MADHDKIIYLSGPRQGRPVAITTAMNLDSLDNRGVSESLAQRNTTAEQWNAHLRPLFRGFNVYWELHITS